MNSRRSPDLENQTQMQQKEPVDNWAMKTFERGLWASRWVIILGVLANIIGAIMMVFVACNDFVHLLDVLVQVVTTSSLLIDNRSMITLLLIEIVDGFLMAGMLFIFGFGLYELFISNLTIGKDFEVQGKILNIDSIDHLKAKLGNLILMILVVKFFYFTVDLEVKGIQEIIIYAGAVCLIGLSLFLSHAKDHSEGKDKNKA